MEIVDLVVTGAGPAGMAAAIYARRSLIDVRILERDTPGGQLLLTPRIDNYPGLPEVSGFDLADRMEQQVKDLGGCIRVGELAAVRIGADGIVESALRDGTVIASKAFIAAMGARARRAGFANETQFTGRGVSYCATCDGMFYRNKQVFVIGGGDSAAVEALHLARFASSVTIVVRKKELVASQSYQKALESNPKVSLMANCIVESVDGSGRVTSIRIRNVLTNTAHSFNCGDEGCGVFVAVGREPATEPLRDLGILDEGGYVVTDERMRTSVPGIFGAGDVRTKSLRQIVTATSDGALAAESAAEYLKAL